MAYLRDELGLDAAFDYHDGPVDALLRAAAPDGIDVYFDNVGGEHLEAALATLRRGGRVALCGAVSTYEAAPAGPRNLFQATANDLTLRGFRGSSHVHRFPDLHRDMGALARRRPRQDPRDGLRRPRARARGARPDARGGDGRQDARPDPPEGRVVV